MSISVTDVDLDELARRAYANERLDQIAVDGLLGVR